MSAASSSTTTTATGATSRSGDPRVSVALVGAVCGVGGDRGKGKGETQSGSNSEPVYQVLGFALKEGHQVHNWKRRFFVVHSVVWESNYALVRYYRDSKMEHVKGEFRLGYRNPVREYTGRAHAHHPHVLTVCSTTVKKFHIAFETAEEKQEWLKTLLHIKNQMKTYRVRMELAKPLLAAQHGLTAVFNKEIAVTVDWDSFPDPETLLSRADVVVKEIFCGQFLSGMVLMRENPFESSAVLSSVDKVKLVYSLQANAVTHLETRTRELVVVYPEHYDFDLLRRSLLSHVPVLKEVLEKISTLEKAVLRAFNWKVTFDLDLLQLTRCFNPVRVLFLLRQGTCLEAYVTELAQAFMDSCTTSIGEKASHVAKVELEGMWKQVSTIRLLLVGPPCPCSSAEWMQLDPKVVPKLDKAKKRLVLPFACSSRMASQSKWRLQFPPPVLIHQLFSLTGEARQCADKIEGPLAEDLSNALSIALGKTISVVIDGKKMCCGMQNPGPLVDFLATRLLAQLLAGVEMACQREALVPILQQKVNSVAVGMKEASSGSLIIHSGMLCVFLDTGAEGGLELTCPNTNDVFLLLCQFLSHPRYLLTEFLIDILEKLDAEKHFPFVVDWNSFDALLSDDAACSQFRSSLSNESCLCDFMEGCKELADRCRDHSFITCICFSISDGPADEFSWGFSEGQLVLYLAADPGPVETKAFFRRILAAELSL